jgi:hypothetical protein
MILPRIFLVTPVVNRLLGGKGVCKVHKGNRIARYLGAGVWYDAVTLEDERKARLVCQRLNNWSRGVRTYHDINPAEDFDTVEFMLFLKQAPAEQLEENVVSYETYQSL